MSPNGAFGPIARLTMPDASDAVIRVDRALAGTAVAVDGRRSGRIARDCGHTRRIQRPVLEILEMDLRRLAACEGTVAEPVIRAGSEDGGPRRQCCAQRRGDNDERGPDQTGNTHAPPNDGALGKYNPLPNI